MDNWDLTLICAMQELFWHNYFYAILYLLSLLSLVLFWKRMERGRRFYLLFSVICLVLFIYNPLFVNLIEKYLLHGDRVIVRLFLVLPVLFTEAYVFASLVSWVNKKSRILSVALSVAIVSVLLFFGVAPWQRAEKGWGSDMYLLSENVYKIPQEHLDICDAILSDMDGDRTLLSMYEMHGINDYGGTLNYSIRMYTSRIQLNELVSLESYMALSSEEREEYWDNYIATIQTYGTDSTSLYFLFPIGDERAADLISYGCSELPVDSSNYQVLIYTP